MGKENRKHKDSVFVDLFYEDEAARENLLSLYNALHDTHLQDESLIRKVRVEDVLYKNFKNDISFEVENQVIVFGEHQSTVNPICLCVACCMQGVLMSSLWMMRQDTDRCW